MKYIGSQTIETERLILKAQSMNEQKRLWQILMIPEVNKYFLERYNLYTLFHAALQNIHQELLTLSIIKQNTCKQLF